MEAVIFAIYAAGSIASFFFFILEEHRTKNIMGNHEFAVACAGWFVIFPLYVWNNRHLLKR